MSWRCSYFRRLRPGQEVPMISVKKIFIVMTTLIGLAGLLATARTLQQAGPQQMPTSPAAGNRPASKGCTRVADCYPDDRWAIPPATACSVSRPGERQRARFQTLLAATYRPAER